MVSISAILLLHSISIYSGVCNEYAGLLCLMISTIYVSSLRLMLKKELRNIYRQKRLELSEKDKMKLDDLLLIQFQNMSFENVHSLFTYWPMPHTAEPDTLLFTRYLLHMIPNLKVAYPVIDVLAVSMQAVLVNEETIYHINTFGTTEPKEGEVLTPASIDLVFIPMLICDKAGYRVGFGKGYYDRYLQHCREDVLKIGFSYFEPVDKVEDTHEFDVPLNYCVTPHRIYEMN